MKTLKEKIDVMQAELNGAKIQCRTLKERHINGPNMLENWGDWKDETTPQFYDWINYDYRVKPKPKKPREFWAKASDIPSIAGSTRIEVSTHGHDVSCDERCPWALFREVLPE